MGSDKLVRLFAHQTTRQSTNSTRKIILDADLLDSKRLYEGASQDAKDKTVQIEAEVEKVTFGIDKRLVIWSKPFKMKWQR